MSVMVLGQTSTLAPVGLAYAPPTVSGVLPTAWSTNTNGAALTVIGRGFGPPSQSSLVSVDVWGTICGDGGVRVTENITLRAQTITVRSNTEMAFEVQGTAGHVVSPWFVSISVAGQAAAGGAWSMSTRRPTTIDGSPCDALTMPQVCVGVLVVVVRGREGVGPQWAPLLCLSCACFPCCKHLTLRATGLLHRDYCPTGPYGPYLLVLSCHNVQPHIQLLCVTRLARGTVRLVTAAGSATPAQYDSVELLQPPIVSSVSPVEWDPSQPTTVVITGERWVVHKCSATGQLWCECRMRCVSWA